MSSLQDYVLILRFYQKAKMKSVVILIHVLATQDKSSFLKLYMIVGDYKDASVILSGPKQSSD